MADLKLPAMGAYPEPDESSLRPYIPIIHNSS